MAGTSEVRRTTAMALDALLDVATERLITHALDALASLVTPSSLARSTRMVSVDTAYRLLDSPERTIQLLASRIITPEFSSDSLKWPTFGEVNVEAMTASGGESSIDSITEALSFLITNNFSLPYGVVWRIVTAATTTVSDRWEGDVRIRDERIEIARRIRDECQQSMRILDDELRWMLVTLLVQLRRRPRSGSSVHRIVVLLRAFADGAIDRMLIDSDVLSVGEVVGALVDLGFALTEDGLMSEVTERFEAPEGFPFDEVVLNADAIWRSGGVDGLLAAVAARTGIEVEVIAGVLPDDFAVAEAVLQCLIVGVPIEGSRETRFALLVAAMHRLAQFADAATASAVILRDLRSPGGALDGLRRAAEDLARERASLTFEPDRLAEQIVTSACGGLGRWEATRFLLDLLRE